MAEGVDVVCGAFAQPAVKLCGVFELLSPLSGDEGVLALDALQRCHVAPDFLELRYEEDGFLAVSPAFFNFFEGYVGGQASGNFADGFGGFLLVC